MGIVNFSVPEIQTEYLRSNLNLDVFVEGGTFRGNTAKNMSLKFKKVYTIEKSNAMFNIARENLKNIPNVDIIKGDTRENLQKIIENNDNILFGNTDCGKKKRNCVGVSSNEAIFSFLMGWGVMLSMCYFF